jgi:GTPase
MQGLALERGQHDGPRPWREASPDEGHEAGASAEWRNGLEGAGHQPDDSWLPPILKTVATTHEGVECLRLWIEAHRTYQHQTGSFAAREAARAASILEETLCQQLRAGLMAQLPDGQMARLVTAITQRQLDPYSAAREILSRHLTA